MATGGLLSAGRSRRRSGGVAASAPRSASQLRCRLVPRRGWNCNQYLQGRFRRQVSSSGQRRQFSPPPALAEPAGGSSAEEKERATPLPQGNAVGESSPSTLARLDEEILTIALPTLATLAADPLAALVSTAWVGQLGSKELAAVGVSLSVYGAFTKLLNMPLLAVVTSATATALGKGGGERSAAVAGAVSSALLLALAIGVVQAALLAGLGLCGLSVWGAGPHSALHSDAAAYLGVRALGAPAAVLFLALQGTFRGLGDTRAPLAAAVASNAVNVALEPLFIFGLGWGVRGAAAATAAAQVVSCAGPVYQLKRRVLLGGEGAAAVGDSMQYVRPTGLLLLRTLSITATFAFATALAARTDTTHATAYQIAFQLWLASSLLADSLAVAAQSLVARSLAAGGAAARADARAVVRRVLNLSLGLGLALAAGLSVGCVALPLPRLFTADASVAQALALLLPAVVATQPLNAVAFTLDGVLYGANGFGYAAKAMAAAALPAVGVMVLGSRAVTHAGLGSDAQLLVVWAGLATAMGMRFLTIFVPLKAGRPPFDKLNDESTGDC